MKLKHYYKFNPREEKSHKKYSASHMDRVIACPGSVALSLKAPKPPKSKYALEGTRAHYCFEMFLKHINQANDVRAQLAKDGFNGEMIDHAHHSRNYVFKLFKSLEDGEIFSERKVDLKWLDPDAGGTLDCALIEVFGWLYIIDFKYGAGYAVEATDNTQLQTYAAGIAHEYDYCFEGVKHIIIQPRADHELGQVRPWSQNIDDLKKFADKLKTAIDESKKPNAPLNPDPKNQCRWCPAAPICPAISKNALTQAQIDFAPKVLNLPDAKSMTPERLGEILKAGEKLKFWLGEVESYAFNLMINEKVSVPGWKLVEKRSIRKWLDPAKTAKEARKKFGDKAFKVELHTPKQIEVITKDKTFVGKHAAQISSGLTMVPENDGRESRNQAQLDFDIGGG